MIIVSGLPRSGTSLMMAMLEAGGVPILTDGIRQADYHNLNGYYEHERVKQLHEGDTGWLEDGKALKVVSSHLEHLPGDFDYKVVFMRRYLSEVWQSQKQMSNGGPPRDVMLKMYEAHLYRISQWLHAAPNFRHISITYNHLIQEPEPYAARVAAFLDLDLDLTQMAAQVDINLYRQRNDDRNKPDPDSSI